MDEQTAEQTLVLCMQGRDINLDIKRVVAYRHWCNKLWNAIKFAMINLGEDFVPAAGALHSPAKLPFACQWILSRLTAAVDSTVKALHEYQFSTATSVRFCLILPPFFLHITPSSCHTFDRRRSCIWKQQQDDLSESLMSCCCLAKVSVVLLLLVLLLALAAALQCSVLFLPHCSVCV